MKKNTNTLGFWERYKKIWSFQFFSELKSSAPRASYSWRFWAFSSGVIYFLGLLFFTLFLFFSLRSFLQNEDHQNTFFESIEISPQARLQLQNGRFHMTQEEQPFFIEGYDEYGLPFLIYVDTEKDDFSPKEILEENYNSGILISSREISVIDYENIDILPWSDFEEAFGSFDFALGDLFSVLVREVLPVFIGIFFIPSFFLGGFFLASFLLFLLLIYSFLYWILLLFIPSRRTSFWSIFEFGLHLFPLFLLLEILIIFVTGHSFMIYSFLLFFGISLFFNLADFHRKRLH